VLKDDALAKTAWKYHIAAHLAPSQQQVEAVAVTIKQLGSFLFSLDLQS